MENGMGGREQGVICFLAHKNGRGDVILCCCHYQLVFSIHNVIKYGYLCGCGGSVCCIFLLISCMYATTSFWHTTPPNPTL